MKGIKILLLLLFPLYSYSQLNVDMLKKEINEKKLVRKLKWSRLKCILSFNSYNETGIWRSNLDYMCIPSFRFTCIIDDSLYQKKLTDIIELEKKNSIDGFHYFSKKGEYIGKINIIYEKGFRRLGSIVINDTSSFSKKKFYLLKSLNPDFVFKVYGLYGVIFIIKDNDVKVIDSQMNIYSSYQEYIKNHVNIKELQETYQYIDKKNRLILYLVQ